MNIFDNPKLKAYLKHAESEMLIIYSDKADVKLCLEVGAAVLFDKPIIVVKVGDKPIPANLKRIASAIVEGDVNDAATKVKLQEAISAVIAKDNRVKL